VPSIRVTRCLDNRAEGQSDDSPRAMELHRLRARALHEMLDDDENWKVVYWGDTDDSRPHEEVELFLEVWQQAVQHAPAIKPVLGHLGDVLLHVGMEVPLAMILHNLVERFRQRAEQKHIARVEVSEGSTTIVCDPGYETRVVITSTVMIPDTKMPPSPIEVPVLVPLSRMSEVAKVLARPKRKR
jgi:hypothetical protein